jgi:hypothetical protein
VDLDAAAVDEKPVWRIFGPGKRTENILPYAALRPTDETVVESLLRSVDIGAISPAPTALQRMNDPAQHTPVIHPPLAPLTRRQKRLNPSPLRI